MDVFEYHCQSDGMIAAFQRDALRDAKPPTGCPLCGGALEIIVVHEYHSAA